MIWPWKFALRAHLDLLFCALIPSRDRGPVLINSPEPLARGPWHVTPIIMGYVRTEPQPKQVYLAKQKAKVWTNENPQPLWKSLLISVGLFFNFGEVK